MICHSDRHRRCDMFVDAVGSSAEASVRLQKLYMALNESRACCNIGSDLENVMHLRFRRAIELRIERFILSTHDVFRSADGTFPYTDLYSTTSVFFPFRVLTTCPYLRLLIGTSCSIGGLPRAEYGARSISWKCANISDLYTL